MEGSRKGKNGEGSITKIISIPLLRAWDIVSETTPAFPGAFPFPYIFTGLCVIAAQVFFRSWMCVAPITNVSLRY